MISAQPEPDEDGENTIVDIKKSFYGVVHGKNHHWWVLAVTSTGSIMTQYDLGAVSMSLPHIMNSFEASLAVVAWVILAQQLTSTALLLPAGRLGDLVGRKTIYNLGFIVFITGAFLCGSAQNLTQLILSRIFQALGSSMLQTSSFAIMAAAFSDRDRGKGMGVSGTLVAIGAVSGPVVGGLLIAAVGWRGVFFFNVPVGIVGAVLAHFILQEKKVSSTQGKVVGRFDILGSFLATVAIGGFLVGMSFGQEAGWFSPRTLLFFSTALAAMIAFPYFESRRAHPLIDVSLLKNRTFALNNIARFILFVSASFNVLLMPFYLQMVLSYSPMETGVLISSMSVIMGIVAPIAGWLTNRISTRVLSAFGMSVMGLGLFFATQLNLHSTYYDVLWRLLMIGGGYGTFQTPNNTSIMDSVSPEKFGITSGLMSLVREMGRAFGTSLASIIVVTSMFSTVGHISLYSLKRGGASAIQGPALQAFNDSISTALLVAAFMCIPGVIFCLFRGKTARDEGKIID